MKTQAQTQIPVSRVPFRVTHNALKWEYPFIFAYNPGQAIQEVLDSLPAEKRSKDIFHFRNWTAKETEA